jgi:hypothetical protein
MPPTYFLAIKKIIFRGMALLQDHELPNEQLFKYCLKIAQGDRHQATVLANA